MTELLEQPTEVDIARRARRLAASAVLLIVAALGVATIGAMWTVARLQHGQDVSVCQAFTPVVGTAAGQDDAVGACVSEREGRRFGPFHVFGNGDPPGGLPQD